MGTGNGGIRGTMEKASPKFEKLTRPERFGGSGWKVACGFLALIAFMGLADFVVIQPGKIAAFWDALIVGVGVLGGGTTLLTLVRMWKK